jgi:hypothetical protein
MGEIIPGRLFLGQSVFRVPTYNHGMALSNQELKGAALIGLRYQRDQIGEQIQQLERELHGADESRSTTAAPPRRKRVLSAAARKRSADAQRKRWAAARAKKAPAAKRTAKKKGRTPAKTMAAGG